MTEDPSEPPSLEVEAEEGRSFQALLCAGSLAEEAEFPGTAELLFAPLDDTGFPVDAVLHAHWTIARRSARCESAFSIPSTPTAIRPKARKAGRAGRPRRTASWRVKYEAVLQSAGHPPMLRAYLGLAVGAADRPELERRVEVLRERFGEVRLHRPRGLQHDLFFDHLPRPDGGSVPDYRQQMTVEQFGAMVRRRHAQELGSAAGPYIGHTPHRSAACPCRYGPDRGAPHR